MDAVLLLPAAAAQRASRIASWPAEVVGRPRARRKWARAANRANVALMSEATEEKAAAYPPWAAKTMVTYNRPRSAQSVPVFWYAMATSW